MHYNIFKLQIEIEQLITLIEQSHFISQIITIPMLKSPYYSMAILCGVQIPHQSFSSFYTDDKPYLTYLH